MSDSDIAQCAAPGCEEIFEKSVWNHLYCSPSCKRAQENARKRTKVEQIASVVASAFEDEDDDLDSQIDYLRRENKRLANLVTKYKSAKSETAEALWQAASEAISRIEVKPVTRPRWIMPDEDDWVVNPWWSDFQLGKHTPSYNTGVCIERVNRLVDHTLNVVDTHRVEKPLHRAHVYMLGDMVEGEDIFAGQHWTIDSGLLEQVTTLVELLVDSLRRLLSSFGEVHVVGVPGNHGQCGGRNSRYYHPDTNFDMMAYKFVEMMFRDEPRITFASTEGKVEGNYYHVDRIGDYGTLLVHGHQFGAPTTGHAYIKKVLGWKESGIKEEFTDVAMGHYHQNTKMTIGRSVLRINGTTETDNLYAGRAIGAMGRPSQHLQLVSPKRGVMAEYDIHLDTD